MGSAAGSGAKRKSLYMVFLGMAVGALILGANIGCAPSDKQIKEWVEKNPEAILKSVSDYQQKMQEENRPKPELVKEFSKELFESESPSISSGDGKIKMAYFFDFNCGHCRKQGETIADVMKKKEGIKVVFKNVPILSPTSETAARAALAAHQQGKYHEFYKELFASNERTPEAYMKIAKKLKLDVAKWEKDQSGDAVSSELARTRDLATKMKMGGTPMIAIAPDKIFPGRVDQLLEVVQHL